MIVYSLQKSPQPKDSELITCVSTKEKMCLVADLQGWSYTLALGAGQWPPNFFRKKFDFYIYIYIYLYIYRH